MGRLRRPTFQKRLTHIVVPHKSIPRFEAVTVVQSETALQAAEILKFGAKCVSVIARSETKVEHTQEYIELVQKYKEVLQPNFKEAKTKHGIEHAIKTKGPPCTAKTRPILPGSQKDIEGHKAWQELVDLGIVEKVKADTPVPWSSALHLQPKPSGGTGRVETSVS